MMSPLGRQIYVWPCVTLNFDLCIPVAVTQWAFIVICACQVWLKFVKQFLRNLAERDIVTYFSLV